MLPSPNVFDGCINPQMPEKIFENAEGAGDALQTGTDVEVLSLDHVEVSNAQGAEAIEEVADQRGGRFVLGILEIAPRFLREAQGKAWMTRG